MPCADMADAGLGGEDVVAREVVREVGEYCVEDHGDAHNESERVATGKATPLPAPRLRGEKSSI